jgi:hypothetical protein
MPTEAEVIEGGDGVYLSATGEMSEVGILDNRGMWKPENIAQKLPGIDYLPNDLKKLPYEKPTMHRVANTEFSRTISSGSSPIKMMGLTGVGAAAGLTGGMATQAIINRMKHKKKEGK